jgi:hypothetical protein
MRSRISWLRREMQMARLLQASSALPSSSTGRSPWRASSVAAISPTGPPPTTATAARSWPEAGPPLRRVASPTI